MSGEVSEGSDSGNIFPFLLRIGLEFGFRNAKKCPAKEQWLNECLKIVSSITENFMACKINAHIQPNAINWNRMDYYGYVKSCGNYKDSIQERIRMKIFRNRLWVNFLFLCPMMISCIVRWLFGIFVQHK